MNFANGMLNLTNWVGNVIMPTLAGLFGAAAIYRFGKAQLAAPCLGGAGVTHVFGAVEGARRIQQPGGLERSRPLLDFDSDAGELGGERASAALRRAPGGAGSGAFCSGCWNA